MNDKQKLIKDIIKRYNSFGWVAFYHPRSKTISLNGGIEKPVNEQLKEMMRCIKLANERTVYSNQ